MAADYNRSLRRLQALQPAFVGSEQCCKTPCFTTAQTQPRLLQAGKAFINQINFFRNIYFLGRVHYTSRKLGAEETSSNQNATPGACPRQPRQPSEAVVQSPQPNTPGHPSRLPMAGPNFPPLAAIDLASFADGAASSVAGGTTAPSFPTLLTTSSFGTTS